MKLHDLKVHQQMLTLLLLQMTYQELHRILHLKLVQFQQLQSVLHSHNVVLKFKLTGVFTAPLGLFNVTLAYYLLYIEAIVILLNYLIILYHGNKNKKTI